MKHLNGGRGSASTGVAVLDDVLEGLYWGDSVLWELQESATAEPFYQAAARAATGFHYAAYVTVTREPASLDGTYGTLDVIDARPGSSHGSPDALLSTLSVRCSTFDRDLLLFDGLDALAEAWGADAAAEFFASTCSLLLELGAIAYWTYRGVKSPALRHAVRHVPQCAIALEELFRDAARRTGVVADLIADDRVAAATLTGSERAGSSVAATAGKHSSQPAYHECV